MAVPTRIIVSGSSSSGFVKAGRVGFFRTLLKNWYYVLILFFLIPGFISDVHEAQAMNFSVPGYVALKTGQTILNADSSLYEDVKVLEKEPSKFIGMENPDKGIWNHIKYYWHIFLGVWKIIGNLFIILLPFNIIYKIVIRKDNSKKWNALFLTILWGFLFVLFMNLIVIVIQQASGNIIYTFEPSLNFFQKAGKVILWIFPFHGVYSLIKLIISLV